MSFADTTNNELECHIKISSIIESKGKTVNISNILKMIEKTIKVCDFKRNPFFYRSISYLFILCAEKSVKETTKIQYLQMAFQKICTSPIGEETDLTTVCNNLYYLLTILLPIYFKLEEFGEIEKCWESIPDICKNNFSYKDQTYILYYIGYMYIKLSKYNVAYIYFQNLLSRNNIEPKYRKSSMDFLKYIEYQQNEEFRKYTIYNNNLI